MNYTRKGYTVWMIYGTMSTALFVCGMKLKTKFSLTLADGEVWITLTTKIINQWCHLLEDDLNLMHLGQHLGLYKKKVDDHVFVMRC